MPSSSFLFINVLVAPETIVSKATPEDQSGDNEDNEQGENKAMDVEDDGLTFELPMPSTQHASGSSIPEIIRASSLEEDKRMLLENIIENMRTNLRATITLLSQELGDEGKLTAEVVKTPAAKFKAASYMLPRRRSS